MYPGQKIKCPHCQDGIVAVPGIKEGKPTFTPKTCKHCDGTGKLVLTIDERFRKKQKQSGIIIPPGGIYKAKM